MREAGELDNELDARTLADFLYSRGIDCMVEPNARKQWSLWVENDDQMAEAERWVAVMREQPQHPEILNGATLAEGKREAASEEQEAFARKQRTRDDLIGVEESMGATPLTFILMAASILVTFFASGEGGLALRLQVLISTAVDQLVEVREGQVWRLVTPIFLHFGIIHLLFNMMWLMDLGRAIEARRGAGFFLVFLLAVAVMSNAGQFFMSGPMFGGMSGVVYALLGYVWMQSRFNPWSGFVLHPMTVQMMLFWYVLCLTGLVGNIANTTHTVGLVMGVAWGYLDARRSVR
jgi:GlpG protein